MQSIGKSRPRLNQKSAFFGYFDSTKAWMEKKCPSRSGKLMPSGTLGAGEETGTISVKSRKEWKDRTEIRVFKLFSPLF
jgi:hypothetical protein